ncbi:MAG TPA: ABC transporter ATP-binding protein [Longimicrobiales bacterium]|nr:ABC transporter ATP-binding protein [Longimicrobiales bacterium]
MTVPAVRLRGVVRRFGPVVALAGADLELRAGEVHAVLGENGAGKSTLLGILGGMLAPHAGVVEIGGRPVTLRSPRDAWAHGVGLVHQHFTLVPALSVLENLALGLGERRGRFGAGLPLERVRARGAELAATTGLSVPLDEPVERLGVGDRQRVEILKALLRDPPILALDEPTAVLTPREVASLFELLRRLASESRAIALVTHKIDEALSVADRVSVLRRGRTTLQAPAAEVTPATLVRAMVGEDGAEGTAGVHGSDRAAEHGPPGERVALLEGVRVRGPTGALAVVEASIAVHRGEIVAIAGVEGNGQRELALMLAGRLAPERGRVELADGIGFVPQDRTLDGLIGDFDLAENVALALHRLPGFARGPLLRWDAVRERAEELRVRFGVRAPSTATLARALSGGNQQRLLVGRELLLASDLLVAENPTRGLDIAATAFVHAELRRIAAPGGPGVVLVSTDLDEVLALGDRVLVMTRGRLIPVPSGERTREGVGALMAGGVIAAA